MIFQNSFPAFKTPRVYSFDDDELKGVKSVKNACLSVMLNNKLEMPKKIAWQLAELSQLFWPISRWYKRVLVDIKVHDLEKGVCPAIPGWHVDGWNPKAWEKGAKEEAYALLVIGSCKTEFVTEDVSIEIPEDIPIKNQVGIIAKAAKEKLFQSPPEGMAAFYNARTIHRAPIAQVDEKRLLIRLCATDVIRPSRNKKFNPTYAKIS